MSLWTPFIILSWFKIKKCLIYLLVIILSLFIFTLNVAFKYLREIKYYLFRNLDFSDPL